MLIPMKWVPYVIIVLGVIGTIVLAIYGGADTGDTIFGIVVCVLSVIGGAIWLAVNIKRNRKK